MKYIKLDLPIVQYIIGALLNIILIIILSSFKISYYNLQVPEGIYKENISNGSGFIVYVSQARNFLDYGVFGNKYVPNYERTIGYPFFLAIMMKSFGSNWLMFTFFVQALLFAAIYPTINKILRIFFGNNKFIINGVYLFLIITGVFLIYTTVIMTDTFMTVFLTFGIYFGIQGVIKKNWIYVALQIIFIGFASQVRPILFLFGIVNCFILYSVAKFTKIESDRKVKGIIIISGLLILIIGNLPTLRNYINYNLLRPASVFDDNIFKSYGTRLLREKNDTFEIDKIYSDTDTIKNLNKQLIVKREYAYQILKQNPLASFLFISKDAGKILLKNHIVRLANFWQYDWKEKDSTATQVPMKKSGFVFIITLLSGGINLIIIILCCKFLFYLIRTKKYFYAFTIVFFIGYFLLPSTIFFPDIRFRLPFESLMIIIAFYEIQKIYISTLNKFKGRADLA